MSEIANIGSRKPARRSEDTASTGVRRVFPAVDVWEDEDAITLVADMPGVNDKNLSVELADHTLTLGGRIGVGLPDGLSARFAELRGSSYERQVALGEGIDTDKIEARIKEGVVTVYLPKNAAQRRRKIAVQTH